MHIWFVTVKREGYESLPFTGAELKQALIFSVEDGSIKIQLPGGAYEVLGLIRRYTL